MVICSSELRALARTKVSSFSSHSPFQSGIPPSFLHLRSQSCAHFDRPGPNRGCIKDGGKFVPIHVGITHWNIYFLLWKYGPVTDSRCGYWFSFCTIRLSSFLYGEGYSLFARGKPKLIRLITLMTRLTCSSKERKLGEMIQERGFW